ncbi:unnamed protein product [Periconia digitata]|uniref:non-specific serine/threonine protein kinase n=1 Tax=Periconia digitata TaxID=1303443 RepID=A0A9W4UBH7_9PLEO|nr:unnamed protein product [Periconia digitata]
MRCMTFCIICPKLVDSRMDQPTYRNTQPKSMTNNNSKLKGEPSKEERLPDSRDGFIMIQRLYNGGAWNRGIFLVGDEASKKLAICKMLYPLIGSRNAFRESGILSRLQGHDNMVHMYRHCITYSENRIYMEYCKGGDLANIIDAYKEACCRIPDSFIWHVAESLMRALCTTHMGIWKEDRIEAPRKDWDPIYHGDIHERNVFITTPFTDSPYPRIVLGDFGSSHHNFGELDSNDQEFVEQLRKRDIVNFGATIHALRRVGPGKLKYSDPELDSLIIRCGTGMTDTSRIKIPFANEILGSILRSRETVRSRIKLEPLIKDFCDRKL